MLVSDLPMGIVWGVSAGTTRFPFFDCSIVSLCCSCIVTLFRYFVVTLFSYVTVRLFTSCVTHSFGMYVTMRRK